MTSRVALLGETILDVSGSYVFEIDFDALIGSHLCIQANSGGGKSRTIRKIMEIAAGAAQRIVVDVEDEFHTLREASPRMVIAGGPAGRLPGDSRQCWRPRPLPSRDRHRRGRADQ